MCAALAGCQAPGARDANEQTRLLRIADYDRYVDNAMTLLREIDAPPAYANRATGEIVSHPTTSGQWFEFWRQDARGGYQVLESSLHTVRRTIHINITPADDGETTGAGEVYSVAVEVDKERLNAPERQITTTSGALSLYSPRVPTVEGTRGSRGLQWVALGRDPVLEAYLLKRLSRLPDVTALPTD